MNRLSLSMNRLSLVIKRSEAISATKPRLPRRFAPRSDDAVFMVTKQPKFSLKTRNDEPDDTSRWQNQLAGVEQSANDGDVQGACLRLDQLLDEAPTYAAAWYLRGVLASAQNDLARAELALDRAAYLDPSHAPTLRLRAELARRSGDNAHADRIDARLKRRKAGP